MVTPKGLGGIKQQDLLLFGDTFSISAKSGTGAMQIHCYLCFVTSISLSVFSLDSKSDCWQRFRKEANARVERDNDVICTTEYSRIVPLENGEVSPGQQQP